VVTTPVVASASATPSATAVAHPIATATPAVKPAVVKPKVSCDPPYTIDKKGHRHFIPECVQ
jgi:hypothetical protein